MRVRAHLIVLLVPILAMLASPGPARAGSPPEESSGAGTVHTDPYSGFSILQPPGWDIRTSDGIITVTQDAQQLVGVLVLPARVNESLPPQAWLTRFGTAIGGALQRDGGSFALGEARVQGQTAGATVKGSTGGVEMLGVLNVSCEPGFVTMRLIFAPESRFKQVSGTLVAVAKSFRRSTTVNVGRGVTASGQGDALQSTALSLQQGQWFRVAAPTGWRMEAENGCGFDIMAPDQSAHVNYGFVLNTPGLLTPQAILQQFLPVAIQNAQVLKTEPVTLQGWNAMSVEVTGLDIALKRPVHAVITAATADYYGNTHYQVAIRASIPERWEMMKGLLAEVQGSIVNYNGNGPANQGLLLPRNNPCDSSSIISSGLYRDRVTSGSGQAWSHAMLGTERVYSPTLRQEYTVSQNAWWGTGPQGPGYYRTIPNGVEKLDVVKP